MHMTSSEQPATMVNLTSAIVQQDVTVEEAAAAAAAAAAEAAAAAIAEDESPVFKYLVEGFLMPAVSAFGIIGNLLSMYILRHTDLKIRPEFVAILCSLATFDNLLLVCTFFLFTMPALSGAYLEAVFPYTVPYLYPITNVFMTCSVYMTAAVGVNRYLDITDNVAGVPRLRNGYAQAAVVLFIAATVNGPRWMEFTYREFCVADDGSLINVTKESDCEVRVLAEPTAIRMRDDYVRDYVLIACSVLVVFVPTACMVVSTLLIWREMVRAMPAQGTLLTDSQEQSRRRRNRVITWLLIGIVVVNVVCHTGEIFLSVYEMLDLLDGRREQFPAWARNMITVNHLLVVVNSSINFIIYCGDIMFRRCFIMIYQALRWRKGPFSGAANSTGHASQNGSEGVAVGNTTTNGGGLLHSEARRQLMSLNSELGISLHGDPSPEVILRDLDPQSMILCGLNNRSSEEGEDPPATTNPSPSHWRQMASAALARRLFGNTKKRALKTRSSRGAATATTALTETAVAAPTLCSNNNNENGACISV